MNVGVLFVHGTSDSSSAQFFNNVFEKSFNAWIENARDYCIQGVDYAAPLDLDALTMVNNVRGQDGRNMLFRAIPMRKFVIFMRYHTDSEYRQMVYLVISRGIAKLADRMKHGGSLVVASHSLGTVVMADYMTHYMHGTMQKNVLEALGEGGRLLVSRLLYFYTNGCPFHWIYPIMADTTIEPSMEWLTSRWINFYYPSDVLVGPIGKLDPKFELVKDVAVPMGYHLLKQTPISHAFYMMDKFVFQYMDRNFKSAQTSYDMLGMPNTRNLKHLEDGFGKVESVNCLLQLGQKRSRFVYSPRRKVLRHATSSISDCTNVHRIGSGKREIAVLYVHGMADSSGAAKQAQCVKNSLNTCVQSINLHHQRLDTVCVLLRTVNYAKLTTQSREKAWQATWGSFPLTLKAWRQYVQSFFPVVMYYLASENFRRLTNAELDEGLEDLGQASKNGDAPLIVIGLNSGALVAATYLGNVGKQSCSCNGHSSLAHGHTLKSLITLSCPFSWFIDPKSFRFPWCGKKIQPGLGWRNIYYQLDITAGPLKPLSSEMHEMVHEDISLRSGWNFLANLFSPFSTLYLSDRRIWKFVEQSIAAAGGVPIRIARKRPNVSYWVFTILLLLGYFRKPILAKLLILLKYKSKRSTL